MRDIVIAKVRIHEPEKYLSLASVSKAISSSLLLLNSTDCSENLDVMYQLQKNLTEPRSTWQIQTICKPRSRMLSELFTQLFEFSCRLEVKNLYSSICDLRFSQLKEALWTRGLSSVGDKSTLRFRLLHHQMQFYHPGIYIPYPTDDNLLSEDEAATWQVGLDALGDMVRAFSAGAEPNGFTNALESSSDKQSQSEMEKAEISQADEDMSIVIEDSVDDWLYCARLLNNKSLRYCGRAGLPAQKFLEQLVDFRRYSGIIDRILLRILPCVLDLETKKWYDTSNFTNWQSFERKFMENYIDKKKSYAAVTAENNTVLHLSNTLSCNESLLDFLETPKLTDKNPVCDDTPMSRILRDSQNSPTIVNVNLTKSYAVAVAAANNITPPASDLLRHNNSLFALIATPEFDFTIDPSKSKKIFAGSIDAPNLEAPSCNSEKYQTSLQTAENESLEPESAIEAINLYGNLVIPAHRTFPASAHTVPLTKPNLYYSLQILNQEHLSKMQMLITYAIITSSNAYGLHSLQAFHDALNNLIQEYQLKVQMLFLNQPSPVMIAFQPAFSHMNDFVDNSILIDNNTFFNG